MLVRQRPGSITCVAGLRGGLRIVLRRNVTAIQPFLIPLLHCVKRVEANKHCAVTLHITCSMLQYAPIVLKILR